MQNTLNSLAWTHPLTHDWFLTKFKFATEPQIQGWPSILSGKTTLISAPTGSGKTLAAFLVCIDRLVRKAVMNELTDETEVLYVSPLKALSHDVHLNLLEPLNEIAALAKARGIPLQEIRVLVRTGDTLPKDRQAMLKKPPHILVTTPESFYILLTAEKSRLLLTTVNTVIVDEIHAVANDKRGTHLTLSLERLNVLTKAPPVRIGLSATQKPLETVARFLNGNQRPDPAIVNIGHARQLDIQIEIPKSELGPVASNEMWDEIYERLAELARQHRSTLIFVNTRRLAERVAHHLRTQLGEEKVVAHHGSLSKKLRLDAETRLKKGELQALVATASLELGIDIGSIDLVCQIGSSRAITVALQRIGRAGHWHGGISKGRVFVTTRDELMECAALVHAIFEGELDQLIIPDQPLDILAQQLVAWCATNDWEETALFEAVKKAYPYRDLSRNVFDEVITMLSEGIAGVRGRYGAYLFRDQVHGIVKGRRGARLTAITNGGAIPDNGLFTVIAEPNGLMVGTLDEDFAVESNRGDIILLGTSSWKIHRIEAKAGRVWVEDAHGAPPSVPFWRGEAPGRTAELSLHVSSLRQYIMDLPDEQRKDWLKKKCGVTEGGADQMVSYLQQGLRALGAIPTQQKVIAERFFDESGGMQLIIHAPFGSRINKAWGLALRKKFCRSFNFELQAAATEDGINIALAEQHSFPLADVFLFLHKNTIEAVLTQAVLQSPLFTTRWRWDATRALALPRFRHGKKVPPNISRMLADDLLAAVFPEAAACQDNLGGRDVVLPHHPLIDETMKDVLTEALDLPGLTQVLQDIHTGKIECIAIDTPSPSVFAHEILNANPYAFLDDAPLEERRARAVEMRRMLPESVLEHIGKLDPLVIKEVQNQAWPDLRDADELHDFLQTLIAMPCCDLTKKWQEFFEELESLGRATEVYSKDKTYWVAAEKQKTFLAIFPHAQFKKPLKEIETEKPTKEIAFLNMIRGWMFHLSPMTSLELSELLGVDLTEVDTALLQLETSGLILRGHFNLSETQWCERRILARIHKMTLGKLRREIEPVNASQFMRWLLRWQHLSPGTQLRDEQGLLEIMKQLQGFEAPANAWEKEILAPRMLNYQRGFLDHLCLTGAIGWGRLSLHPVLKNEEDGTEIKRVVPTSNAPLTFFVRGEAEWMKPFEPIFKENTLPQLSHAANKIYQFIKTTGASFFTDIVEGVGHLKSEVETGLWELVTAGLITADSFDNLRGLIDGRRRRDKKRRRLQTRFSGGRWSLIKANSKITPSKQVEATCWMLLKRYGVVFRDLIVKEKNVPAWRELLVVFRRLEERGEIRGGRFVDGFLGEQFALPYAIASLRAIKKEEESLKNRFVAAADPLNLVGFILPGTKTSAISGKTIVLYPPNESEIF